MVIIYIMEKKEWSVNVKFAFMHIYMYIIF